MNDPDAFFGMAKRISLQPAEKAAIWQELLAFREGGLVRKEEAVRHTKRMPTVHQFIKAAQSLQMTDSEKNESYARISERAGAIRPRRSFGEMFDLLLPRLHFAPVLASVLLLAMTIGGTVSYAAESAMP